MRDGSIVSSYFGSVGDPSGQDVYNEGLRFSLGQIEKIHFVDDPSNVSKKFVEYDVSVQDAKGGQSTFRNVRTMSAIFGFNDFEETILEPNAFAFSGKLDPSNFFANKNGTIVIIGHLHGSLDKPFIIGAWQHPKYKGAKRSDGIRKKGEFRGIAWEINKEGELSIKYQGNRSPDGELVREDTGPTEIKIDKNGVLTFTDNEEQKFEMSRTTKTFKFTNGVSVTFDGENDKVIVITTGGAKLEIDGDGDKITAETSGGAKIEIDGNGDKVDVVTAGGTEAIIDGTTDKIELLTSGGAEAFIDGVADVIQLTAAGTGELKIENNKVALGASTAELLQQIYDSLQELITLFAAVAVHTHPGVLPGPSSTGPPSTAAAWTTAAANLTAIQVLVNSIKGTL